MNTEAINNTRNEFSELPFLFLTKEDLKNVQFSNDEVWYDEAKRQERYQKLKKALVLGNVYKNHVRLLMINNAQQHIQTKATIWAVTEKYVTLKGGVIIPIGSIMDVKFC